MGREKWVQKSLFPSPNRGRIPLGMLPSCPLGLLARSVPRSAPAWQLCVFPVTMATLPGPPGHRAGGPSLGEVSMGKASVGNTPQVWNFHPGQGWGGALVAVPARVPALIPTRSPQKAQEQLRGISVLWFWGLLSYFSSLFLSLPSALKITAHKQRKKTQKILKMAPALRLHKIDPGSFALFPLLFNFRTSWISTTGGFF